MKIAACLTRFEREWDSLRDLLDSMAVTAVIQPAADLLLRHLAAVRPDIYLIDSRTPRAEVMSFLCDLPQDATALLILPSPDRAEAPANDWEAEARIYDSIDLLDTAARQRRSLARATERASLLTPSRAMQVALPVAPIAHISSRSVERPWEMALRSLSRTLSAGFDIKELLEPFLDLAMDLAGAARGAVLTLDPERPAFSVKTSRGLYGPMLRTYSHARHAGLMDWLWREGRPMRREDVMVAACSASPDIQRSFDILQATVCIPMAARGELLAILALGSRINGEPPTDDQVEMLFTIGTHVAAALQNSSLHHEVAQQKAQWESVLEHMTNGIAVINGDGRITVFNRRAAEILQLSPADIVGRDLRALPAPLGDFLFSAMATARPDRFKNLQLPGSELPMEVSTYPLMPAGFSQPVGSVLVMEDLTERRALEASRRYADQQDVLSRLVGQLSHEVKNPLVAVKTFADLFPHDHGDYEFQQFVRHTVIPEIFRLDEIMGKLVDFTHKQVPEMRSCSPAAVVRDVVDRLSVEAAADGMKLEAEIENNLPAVWADPIMITKAISYLVRHVMSHLQEKPGGLVQLALGIHVDRTYVSLHISADRSWTEESELERMFDPLLIQADQLNLALPVSRKIIQEHRGDVEVCRLPDGKIGLRVLLRGESEQTGPEEDMIAEPFAAPWPMAAERAAV